MRKSLLFLAVLGVIFLMTTMPTMAEPGSGSGYGYYLTNDDDGDGIPNGQDEDWIAPEDGTGYMHQNGQSEPETVITGTTEPAGNGSDNGDHLQIMDKLQLHDGSCQE